LAGILLKLGGYGLLRYTIFPFSEVMFFLQPLLMTVAFIGLLYSAFIACAQEDFKRVIAYSSIIHMNTAFLALLTGTQTGVIAFLMVMVSHGFVSPALFTTLGFLYDRYGSRLITNYGGLIFLMPVFSVYFFLFSLANIGFPGTLAFISEILCFFSLFNSGFYVFVTIVLFGTVLSILFGMGLFNRINFGPISLLIGQTGFADLSWREFIVLNFYSFFIFIFGFFPNILVHFFLNCVKFYFLNSRVFFSIKSLILTFLFKHDIFSTTSSESFLPSNGPILF
jgi:NADH-quinone oxidoreductase subunit M